MKAIESFLVEKKRLAPVQQVKLYSDPPSLDVQSLCLVIDKLREELAAAKKRIDALEKASYEAKGE